MTSPARKMKRRSERATLKAARSQKCSDCNSEIGSITRRADGILIAQMLHDDNCPAMLGYTPMPRAIISAARANGDTVSLPVMGYVGDE